MKILSFLALLIAIAIGVAFGYFIADLMWGLTIGFFALVFFSRVLIAQRKAY